MELRRNTAIKCVIKELVDGIFVGRREELQSPYVISPFARKIARARVMANVVDMYVNKEKGFGFLVLDDGTATVRAKSFSGIKMLESVKVGDLVDVIGKVRKSGDEVWISAEIVRKVEDPNFETLRALEVTKQLREQEEKIRKIEEVMHTTSDVDELIEMLSDSVDRDTVLAYVELKEKKGEEKEEIGDVEEKVLNLIKELDPGDGADYFELLKSSGLKEEELDKVLQSLLEKGVCYEPMPGKIKVIE